MTQAGVWLVARNAEALDEAAFSRCCEELRPAALRFAAGMLAGDRDRAEELVQEALLRLHGARGRYRPEPGDVRRYAFRVLANLCLDEIRRRKIGNQAMAGAGELARGRGGRGPGGPAAEAESSERRAAVAGAVERLPERERAALLLRELGGHSYAEIAEEMETTVSDVNNLIHRARGRFVRLMRPWME
jgi:RNA polymerase sigma-70 factor (ECF subfamily)